MGNVMLSAQTNINGINFSDGMHPPGFKPFTKELLIRIVDQISKNNEVRKIILFGSYAYPDSIPTPDVILIFSSLWILIWKEVNASYQLLLCCIHTISQWTS
jgi:hypothetical protein